MGRADVIWRDTSSGLVAAWLMTTGTGAVGPSGVLATIPVDWIIGPIIDLDNNGRADVVWHHPPTRNRSGVVDEWSRAEWLRGAHGYGAFDVGDETLNSKGQLA